MNVDYIDHKAKQKLAVTLWNFKGGVGKSTISLVLAEIASMKGLRTLAVDLDEQQNLAQIIRLTETQFPTLEIRTTLDAAFADEDFDMFILDTHPSKDETIKAALAFADIVLIPILSDYLSIVNLRSAIDYVTTAGVGKEQVAIVKNCMNSLKMTGEVEAVIDSQSYHSAGRLPRSNILVRNIASGQCWDKSMSLRQRKPFRHLYDNIWSAYRDMFTGKFHHLWRD